MNRITVSAWRMGLLVMAAISVPGCSDNGTGSENECAPLAMKCEGDVVFRCAPDIERSGHGQYVYVWHETLVCEDDEVFGPATCVESTLPTGRVDAECEYESAED